MAEKNQWYWIQIGSDEVLVVNLTGYPITLLYNGQRIVIEPSGHEVYLEPQEGYKNLPQPEPRKNKLYIIRRWHYRHMERRPDVTCIDESNSWGLNFIETPEAALA